MTQLSLEEPPVPRMTPAVQWIVALNVVVFFLQFTLFGASNMRDALGFRLDELPSQWWTVGTHMFVHSGFWTLLLNMYLLFIFGPRLEHAWGTRAFRNFFLWCGLGGWLAHVLIVRDATLIGATGAALGVTLAYALRWADDEVYLFLTFPVKVKWLVAALASITLAVGAVQAGDGNGAAYLTHAGGLAAAWLFWRTSTAGAGFDRLRQRVNPVPDLPDEAPRAVPRSMPRNRERTRDIDDIVAQSQQAVSQRVVPTVPSSPARPHADRDSLTELDRVLDKISQTGIDSLTGDERRILEERSRELRRND
ncbi:MAG TPA: rhomboid family intramembrane serine protease [Gemmatimonadaceae bacterium]|nr:rhomboid family intramembrane serine protease [Gemmatimonadaceae bacterium]